MFANPKYEGWEQAARNQQLFIDWQVGVTDLGPADLVKNHVFNNYIDWYNAPAAMVLVGGFKQYIPYAGRTAAEYHPFTRDAEDAYRAYYEKKERCEAWMDKRQMAKDNLNRRLKRAMRNSGRWVELRDDSRKRISNVNFLAKLKEFKAMPDLDGCDAALSLYLRVSAWSLTPSTPWGDTSIVTSFLNKKYPNTYPNLYMRADGSERMISPKLPWRNEAWFIESPYALLHCPTPSEKDPKTLIAYTMSQAKLEARVTTPIKPGKYLQKYFGHVLTEPLIRQWANAYIVAMTPPVMYLIPNDSPDGWEHVYEHGHGFKSCMVWDREDTYLSRTYYNKYGHPVRAYAHPESELALAYLPLDKMWKPTPECPFPAAVIARTVVNTVKKTYVRIYGNDTMADVLAQNGYKADKYGTLAGQPMTWIGDDSVICMPYLDDIQQVEVDPTARTIVIDTDGNTDAACSSGYTSVRGRMCDDDDDEEYEHHCDCCGDGYNDGDGGGYSDYHGLAICENCIDDFCYAYTSRRNQDWIRADECYEYGSEYYTMPALEVHDLIMLEDGEIHHQDNVVMTVDDQHEHIDNCVELTVYSGGDDNLWAHRDNTTETEDGKTIHDDDAVTDAVTGGAYYKEDCWRVQPKRSGDLYLYLHPITIEGSFEDFVAAFVLDGDKLVFKRISSGCTPINANTLDAIVDISNVEQGDDNEQDFYESLVESAGEVAEFETEEPELLAA
jgi:hypothetical protein